MKVLKPGRAQKGYSVEAICTGEGNRGGGCGAKLLVEQTDMRWFKESSTGWGPDSTVSFRCCNCGVVTDLQSSKWPPNASNLAPYTKEWAEGRAPSAQSEK